MTTDFEVLIIGGGAAGLSAALTLGRMSRKVLVCDDEQPRNAPAIHMNNFPSQDGVHPEEWRRRVRRDLEKYNTVHFYNTSVLEVKREEQYFRTKLSSGKSLKFRKVILAYGVRDKLPSIPGMKELWGKSVFHCPYCHGYEVRNTRLGLVANGQFAAHLFPKIYSLSKEAILFTNGQADLSNELKTQMSAKRIQIVEGKIKALNYKEEALTAIVLENEDVYERDGIFWAPNLPFQSKSQIGDLLGCEKNEMGFYLVNPTGKTTAEGVYAAGDITAGAHSVLGAAAAGQTAAAGVVAELVNEDFSGS